MLKVIHIKRSLVGIVLLFLAYSMYCITNIEVDTQQTTSYFPLILYAISIGLMFVGFSKNDLLRNTYLPHFISLLLLIPIQHIFVEYTPSLVLFSCTLIYVGYVHFLDKNWFYLASTVLVLVTSILYLPFVSMLVFIILLSILNSGKSPIKFMNVLLGVFVFFLCTVQILFLLDKFEMLQSYFCSVVIFAEWPSYSLVYDILPLFVLFVICYIDHQKHKLIQSIFKRRLYLLNITVLSIWFLCLFVSGFNLIVWSLMVYPITIIYTRFIQYTEKKWVVYLFLVFLIVSVFAIRYNWW